MPTTNIGKQGPWTELQTEIAGTFCLSCVKCDVTTGLPCIFGGRSACLLTNWWDFSKSWWTTCHCGLHEKYFFKYLLTGEWLLEWEQITYFFSQSNPRYPAFIPPFTLNRLLVFKFISWIPVDRRTLCDYKILKLLMLMFNNYFSTVACFTELKF